MSPMLGVVRMADLLERAGRKRVLDIGCGSGRHVVYLAARGFAVTGLDIAPEAIEACREGLAEARLTATIVEGEMTDLPFADGSFDGIVASHVIHHCQLASLRRILDHVTRCLTPGGLLFWSTPTPRHFRWGRGKEVEPGTYVDADHPEGPIPHHYSTEEEVRELLEGYHILSIEEVAHRDEDHARFRWRVPAWKLWRWLRCLKTPSSWHVLARKR
jgi:SAM-dependent methyltransferase